MKKDEGRAKTWYEKAAVAGNPDAQYELGMIYIKGKGVPKSEADGIAWLRKAAEAGHAEAKKELASRRSS